MKWGDLMTWHHNEMWENDVMMNIDNVESFIVKNLQEVLSLTVSKTVIK